ncbi:DUF1116 domain-containing protein [Flavonifractor porci]|uniref:DUF1116 domain-containing protein n=1 Tax=Flavonifractor porci TaxID=3133422 RepID=UPI0030ABE856
MNKVNELFGQTLQIFNVGAPNFGEDLKLQNADVTQIKWVPPLEGDIASVKILDNFACDEEIDAANRRAVEVIMGSQPTLVGIEQAVKVIPGMTKDTILHSGPPITWDRMCGTVKGAIIGALMYEGRAVTAEEAEKLAASGEITFAPCHEYGAVGPMAGIISPSMPVHIVENKAYGNRAYCTVNEGLGKVLRFGAFSQSVLDRLRWIQERYMPVLQKALELSGGIDLKVLIAQAVQMGDECHNRNKAATSLFFREIVPYMMKTGLPQEQVLQAVEFIKGNDHYFLNLSMPACKASLDAASGIEKSTVLTAMARNGVDFGIRVSGLGDQWFTAPANMVQGLLFPGYSEEDANPDLGDSAITETTGIGGFAMGASPAITQFVGGTVADALEYTRSMYLITTAENNNYALPPLNFKGAPTGIDLRKVLESGILPVINTGIAHKTPGIGQVGAGIVHPPKACFLEALRAYDRRYGGDAQGQ